MVLQRIPLAKTNEERQEILRAMQERFGSLVPQDLGTDPEVQEENPLAAFAARVAKDPAWDETPDLAARICETLIDLQYELRSAVKEWILWGPELTALYPLLLEQVLAGSRGDLTSCLPRAMEAARSGKPGLRDTAVVVIERSRVENKLDLILEYLAYNGANQYPFPMGRVLIGEVGSDAMKLARLREVLRNGRGKVREGILETVRMMEGGPESFKGELTAIAREGDREEKNLAIIDLGYVSEPTPAIEAVLREETRSKHYCFRGNAIVSAARLRLDADFFVPRARALLEDREGYDWTVRECAVEALGHYGAHAAHLRGDLERLRQEAEEEEFLTLIDEAIAKISSGE
jgi:hypothetical protein